MNDDRFARALMRSAKQKLREEDAAGALAVLRLLRELSPEDAEVAMLHGVAAQRCHHAREAIAAYEACLPTYGDDLHVVVNLAEMHLHELSVGRATELIRRAMALDPNITHPMGYRARVIAMRAKEQIGTS